MTDRRAGSVGVNVDLAVNPNRRVGAIGVNVDYVAPMLITVSATQATAVARSFTIIPGGPILLTVSATQSQFLALASLRSRTLTATQAQTVGLGRVVSLVRRIQQSQTALIAGSLARAIAVTQATSARLIRQVRLTRAATSVGQVLSGFIVRGYQRVVTTTQTQAVSLRKAFSILVRVTGNRRVAMNVSLGRQLGRTLRATEPTSPRLVKQVRLTRAVTQSQSVALSGVPVQLQAVATIQTRSLDLGRVVSLTRAITQAQHAVLPRVQDVLRTLSVAPVLQRVQDVTLTRSVAQGALVSLSARNVTPFYQLIVTTSVSQAVSLSSATGGQSAADFVIIVRGGDFVLSGRRTDDFLVPSRGISFRVEEP